MLYKNFIKRFTLKTYADAPKYLPSVSVIRGVAALAVCLFHFTKGFIAKISGVSFFIPYSWIGVEVFFVISGFVIPYALIGSYFKSQHYKGYLFKRLIRIEPAYLVSIVLVLFLNYLSALVPFYQGEPFEIDWSNLALHLGYLVNFFDQTWLNPVYWTLAIEFQFYILIGLLILIWNNSNKYMILFTVLGFLALSFIPQDTVRFFKQTDIFTMGVVCAFYKRGRLDLIPFLFSTIVIGIIIYINHHTVIVVLSYIAVYGIAFLHNLKQVGFLVFFGNISYSLYLLHIPIGGRVINLSKRLPLNDFGKMMAVALAVVISIVSAYIFYKVVEQPTHRFSKRFKLK